MRIIARTAVAFATSAALITTSVSAVPVAAAPIEATMHVHRSPDRPALLAKLKALPRAHVAIRLLPPPYDTVARRAVIRARFASKPAFALVNGHFVPNPAAAPLAATHPLLRSTSVVFKLYGGSVHTGPATSAVAVAPGVFGHNSTPMPLHATVAGPAVTPAHVPAASPVPASVDYGTPTISAVYVDGVQNGPVIQGSTIIVLGQNLGGLSHVTGTPYGTLAFMKMGDCSNTHLVPTSNFLADGSSMEIDVPQLGLGDAPWISDKVANSIPLQLIGPGGAALQPLQWKARVNSVTGYTGSIGDIGTGYNNDIEGLGFSMPGNTTIVQPWNRTGFPQPTTSTNDYSGTDTLGAGVFLTNGYTLDAFTFNDYPYGQAGASVYSAPANGASTGQSLTTVVKWWARTSYQNSSGSGDVYQIEYNYSGPAYEPPTNYDNRAPLC
jgi:hypothetical protein